MSTRLDAWLVQTGQFGGRDTAKRHIEAGEVTVNGRVVKKPAFAVEEGDQVVCAAGERYVGRGGYKLEKAILSAGLDLNGVIAIDVGASTGGFTDCMLQHGAEKVYAVDVGHGQLHETLRAHRSVVNLENTDVRAVTLPDTPSFCSVDVSFISLKQVMPTVLSLLAADATVVCLIKPQFEAGRAAIGKNGVVKDKNTHIAVLRDLCAAFADWQCGLLDLTFSPIRGGEGNVEYLATLRRGVAGVTVDVKNLVNTAFQQL